MPTTAGTYDVGVVTEGSDTYKAIGSAEEPFTANWTYTVKETPTEADFSYNSSTGIVSAAAGKTLGTVTTYYQVDGTWSTTMPTTAGTYDVGVVTEGSDTYNAVGFAEEPFAGTWTYTVKATPTASDFSYDSSTGIVSAAAGKDLGTVTTYYRVDGTWSTTRPTTAGSYDVGVVTEGSDTYNPVGFVEEPFAGTWTYTVKASDGDGDSSDSDKKDNIGKTAIATDKQAGNFAAGGLVSTADELKNAVLTDTDKAAIAAGKDLSVWVEMKDQTSTVSDTDKTAVTAKLPTNYVIGSYLDINLWKQVEGSTASKVTETANGKVKIAFTIPTGLQKSGRIYKLIRLHDSEAAVLDTTVDANYALTFETDRFSTYALVYADAASEEETTTTTSTTTTTTDTTATSSTAATDTVATSPKTGDTTNMALYLVMLMIGATGIAGVAFRRKRQ